MKLKQLSALSLSGLVLILLIQLSCKNKTKINNSSIPVKRINYSKHLTDKVKLSQFFNKYKFIVLSTGKNKNEIVGNIDKLLSTDNRIIVFDNDVTNKVFVYDSSGNFKFSPQKGEGPKEVKSITDFCVDRTGNRLLLLDNHSRSIKIFSLNDGGFLNTCHLGAFFDGIGYLHDNQVILYNSSLSGKKEKLSLNISIYSIDNSKVLKQYSILNKNSSRYLFYASGNVTFLQSDSTLYYSFPYGDKVYMISKRTGDVKTRLIVNFEKKSLSQFSDKIQNAAQLTQHLSNTAYFTGSSGAIDNNYLFYTVANEGAINFVFIKKNTLLFQATKQIYNDLFMLPVFSFIGSSYNGNVYYSLPPEIVNSVISSSNKIYKFLIKKLGKDKVDDNLNPILVRLWNN